MFVHLASSGCWLVGLSYTWLRIHQKLASWSVHFTTSGHDARRYVLVDNSWINQRRVTSAAIRTSWWSVTSLNKANLVEIFSHSNRMIHGPCSWNSQVIDEDFSLTLSFIQRLYAFNPAVLLEHVVTKHKCFIH